MVLKKTRCMICNVHSKPLFCFPRNSARMRMWLKMLKLENLLHEYREEYIVNNGRLCEAHFHLNAFSSTLKERLSRFALPIDLRNGKSCTDVPPLNVSFPCSEELKIKQEETVERSCDESTNSLTFSTLVRNLDSISKPNHLWGITAHKTFVMCAKWDENYKIKRRLIIDSYMKIKGLINFMLGPGHTSTSGPPSISRPPFHNNLVVYWLILLANYPHKEYRPMRRYALGGGLSKGGWFVFVLHLKKTTKILESQSQLDNARGFESSTCLES